MAGLIKLSQNFCRNLLATASEYGWLVLVFLFICAETVWILAKSAPRPRMIVWTIIAAALLGWNAHLQPEHLPELLYKLNNVAIGAVAAYWIDRELAPYGRPDQFLAVGVAEGKPLEDLPRAVLFFATQLRRALIFAAVMAGLTLGI